MIGMNLNGVGYEHERRELREQVYQEQRRQIERCGNAPPAAEPSRCVDCGGIAWSRLEDHELRTVTEDKAAKACSPCMVRRCIANAEEWIATLKMAIERGAEARAVSAAVSASEYLLEIPEVLP